MRKMAKMAGEKKKKEEEKQEEKAGKTPHSLSFHPIFQGTTYFPKKTGF